jgi:crotonobetainyl-CoA:carnitine CoA-transferase CaiB-like acyl-CoA transferase
VMRTGSEWKDHPQGAAVAAEPLVEAEAMRVDAPALPASGGAPLGGIRVLDLTRVIAGPVCTRFLAAYGADVLRIDPPGFEEVGALLAETTAGKRRAALDLRDARERGAFERLVASAHVLVSSYRADALERLGLSQAALRAKNPALIVASLDAYGHTGPWRARRGFDSLVQMSCGIAARGQEAAGADVPVPLPAQALDHGTGYLLAAAVCRALTRRLQRNEASVVRTSLARTAAFLADLGEAPIAGDRDFTAEDAAPWLETVESAWGPLARVRCPGQIEGTAPGWQRPPGPLGSDPPAW